MKKSEQIKINERVIDTVNTLYADELETAHFIGQLRSCSAVVLETSSYYVLKSYDTIIACIDKSDNTLYDFLRYVYCYTATSAQHIAKFRRDYGDHYAETYTYKEI